MIGGSLYEKLSIMVIVIILLLFAGKPLGLPITVAYTVGASMYPTLRGGDIVICVSTRLTELSVGDIAVYETSTGKSVVHRVIAIENNTVIFKGDNNPEPDEPVDISQVKYKVVARISPEIWVPVVAIALSGNGIFLVERGRRQGGDEIVLTATVLYFVALTLFVISVTINTMFVEVANIVTYNPPLDVKDYSYENGVLTLYLENSHKFKSLTCSVNEVVVPCVASGDRIELSVGEVLASLCMPGHCMMRFKIVANVTNHVVVIYDIGIGFYAQPLNITETQNGVVILNPNNFPVKVRLCLAGTCFYKEIPAFGLYTAPKGVRIEYFLGPKKIVWGETG